MKPLSRHARSGVLAMLVLAMLATRFHHFGTALSLPDASMAVFFLGGVYLSRDAVFLALLVLAVGVDWVSIDMEGVSSFCVTPAYAFLLPAYAVLWYGGRAAAGWLRTTLPAMATVLGVASLCASVSFLLSNGSFYWLGGRYEHRHFAEYLSRAWQWGPLFVRTTLSYVAAAFLIHALVAWRARRAVASDAAAQA